MFDLRLKHQNIDIHLKFELKKAENTTCRLLLIKVFKRNSKIVK